MSVSSRRTFLGVTTLLGLLGRRTVSSAAAPLFTEVPPHESGITWVHDNAFSPDHYLPETHGPGCAFLDYDNDGWMDIYLTNSGPCDFYRPKQPIRNALYKNNRDGTFADVTETAGVPGRTFGMGVAVGDYNNDGYPDLFVTSYGRCLLYRNNGDGTFAEVAEQAGLLVPGTRDSWTTSAVWFDFDNDGFLDLFVCRFVEYSRNQRALCGDKGTGPRYCVPRLFKPTASLLFRNRGDGTFTEVGHATDIARNLGKPLGVVAADLDNDGRLDLFITNDTEQNFLFMNRISGRWEETGLAAGVALSGDGLTRSGMGVDAADFDGDGQQDLFVGNINTEVFALYRSLGPRGFEEVSLQHDIAQATYYMSGWGLKFFDFDNDGAIDLIVANGHPDDMVSREEPRVQYRQPLLLFRQQAGRLRNISSEAGPAFAKSFAARGLAVGDYDNDGRVDVLVGINGGPPLLLRNRAGRENHWLGLKLVGKTCNRDAVGARVTWSAGGVVRSRFKNGGGSYLSSHDPRIVLGLGSQAKADWLEIRWPPPSGRTEKITALPVDRYCTVVEGSGVLT